MRALVFSDSHGRENMTARLISLIKNVDVYIFLGDGERDIYSPAVSEKIGFKKLVAVQGNCDFGSSLPVEETVILATKKILCLHGHSQLVKHGFSALENRARQVGADVAVHGHTHEQRCEYSDGIWYMCPGAVRDGEYGIIDVDEKTGGIFCYTGTMDL